MALEAAPTASEGSQVINLDAQRDSQVSSVSIYPGRAEVTREFRFAATTGQNQLVIKSLPSVMDRDTLRVDGHGALTVQGVSVSETLRAPPKPETPEMKALRSEEKRLCNALKRNELASTSLEQYLTSMHVSHTPPNQVGEVLALYNLEAEKIEQQHTALRRQRQGVIEEWNKEDLKNSSGPFNQQLSVQATIDIFAPAGGEATITIVYGVISARWTPRYDLRVNMQDTDKPFTVVYQAEITQQTGEDWTDAKVTLETITPSVGGMEPTLYPWRLTTAEPPLSSWSSPQIVPMDFDHQSQWRPRSPRVIYMDPPSVGGPPPQIIHVGDPSRRSRSTTRSPSPRVYTRSPSYRRPITPPPLPLVTQYTDFTGHGTISATYLILGQISVPSDSLTHKVMVAQLELEAELSWVAVPKYNSEVYIKVKAKNISEFILLEGRANIYVDGSFVSKSDFPLVNPGETFDYSLGVDHAIRVTYHPQIQKTSQSGTIFTQKTSSQLYTQRITIQNTKNSTIHHLKVLDQIPISENSLINVKLIKPPVRLISPPGPPQGKSSTRGFVSELPQNVNVHAQWIGVDEAAATGADGQLRWDIALESQQTVNLSLEWEVSAPAGTQIHGL